MNKFSTLRTALLLIMIFAFASVVKAQNNTRVPFYIGEIQYKSPNALNTIMGVVGLVGDDQHRSLELEDKSTVPALTNSIKTGCNSVYRLIVQEGNEPAGAVANDSYVLDVLLSDVMTGMGKTPIANAEIKFTLTNLKTGKVVAKDKYHIAADGFVCPTLEKAIEYMCASAECTARDFLLACFPLRGTVLEKGVEQANGKVKESQCYIDLGDKYGIYKGMKFIVSIDNNGKLKDIGKLKYYESQGDDIAVCKITKGADKIGEALAKNQKVVVTSKVDMKVKVYIKGL